MTTILQHSDGSFNFEITQDPTPINNITEFTRNLIETIQLSGKGLRWPWMRPWQKWVR